MKPLGALEAVEPLNTAFGVSTLYVCVCVLSEGGVLGG